MDIIVISGIKVQEGSYLIETGGQCLGLDISGFTPGIYLISLITNSGRGIK